MNKKFLSAILFGALMITATSTFVSCKDYDDDIEDLQSQISSTSSTLQSNLSSIQSSLQSELSSTQSSLQSQITSAQSTLQSAIDAKADASEITALAENVATLTTDLAAKEATLTAQIEAANKAIEELTAASNASSDELQTAIDAANATLAALTGDLADESDAREAADANLQIQLDALNEFQATVEAADYQAQIDALKSYLGADDAEDYANMSEKIEAVKAELNEAIEANTTDIAALKEQLQAISDALVDINPNLDAITVLVESGVTSVELVLSYTAENLPSTGTDLTFTAAIVQKNTFVPGIENAIEFTAGDLVQVPATFVVRVSPVNATLTPDMIHFVNSKGETLDGIVNVTKVEKYNELLTRGAATGLYSITVELENGQIDAFEAATTTDDDKSVLFAVQINNTIEAYADRYATSTYDLTMAWKPYTGANDLNFTVGDKDIAELNNRYENPSAGNPSLPYTTDEITYTELVWTGDAAVEAITEGTDANAEQGDNRADQPLYLAEVGTPITISIYETDENDKSVAPSNIRAMYVALDFEENAIESAPSEWNAWTKYSYSGLNTVVENTGDALSTTITVNSTEANGDIIGFRVFAVNYDGTLVDPDGKAFYVSLGDASTSLGSAAIVVIPTSEEIVASDPVSVTLNSFNGSTDYTYTWKTDEIEGIEGNIFDITLSDGKNTYTTSNGTLELSSALNFSTITKITATPTGTDWTKYEDGKTYTGTLTIANTNGRTLATLTVTFEKDLPTGLPYSADVKTNQLIDGVYYAFMVPSDNGTDVNWSASATYGTMAMTSVFNYENEDVIPNYQITWGTSDKDSKGNLIAIDVAGDETLAVEASYVDNKTLHTVTVGYNYGKISSETPNEDYVTYGYDFKAMYVCLYYENVYTWAWAKGATTTLIYGTEDQIVSLDDIIGTSVKDSDYNATANGGVQGSLTIESATLTTDANSKEGEYFTIEVNTEDGTLDFTPVSVDTNVTDDVASTLTLTGTDCYGHTVTITLPMAVTKR